MEVNEVKKSDLCKVSTHRLGHIHHCREYAMLDPLQRNQLGQISERRSLYSI